MSYLRVSGKGQIRGHGLTRQRDRIARFAKASRTEIVDEFADRGVSGTNELAHRKGLAALLDRLETNGIRIVLVESADRLARDLMVQEVILSQFRIAGVAVLTASGVDLTDDRDPTKKMIRQVLGAVAEFDKNITVLKLRAARERIRKRQGTCEGRKPFGYYEGETEVVREIMRMRRKPRGERRRRMSWDSIAACLNETGHSTRTGRKWIGATVRRIALRGLPKDPPR